MLKCDREHGRSWDPLREEPTWWGAPHRRDAWCSAAGTWRSLAAFPAAWGWWGCDPCPSRSPWQPAPRACLIALWRSAVGREHKESLRQNNLARCEWCCEFEWEQHFAEELGCTMGGWSHDETEQTPESPTWALRDWGVPRLCSVTLQLFSLSLKTSLSKVCVKSATNFQCAGFFL